MCTLVILHRPGAVWPVILGANRDEMRDRAWLPPARHWSDRPEIVAGLDELAGGSWMGVNDHGLAACILNRYGTLGPSPGKRSRGELVLEALDHADAIEAVRALTALNPDAYRPFNLIVADNREIYWLAHRGGSRIDSVKVPEGLSVITAGDLNDLAVPRIAHNRPRFLAANPPEPDLGDFTEWEDLLTETNSGDPHAHDAAMSFGLPTGYGTVCHSILALPTGGIDHHPVWRFAPKAEQASVWSTLKLD